MTFVDLFLVERGLRKLVLDFDDPNNRIVSAQDAGLRKGRALVFNKLTEMNVM